jgi:chaperonin cofactor prefoldin
MAATMFAPVGEKARWRTVYDLLRKGTVGDVITYAEMAEALEVHPERDRNILRSAVPRAAREFEEVDNHAITPVRNVGYRVVEASEHMGLAKVHQRKSSRQLRRSRSKVVHVDMNALSPELQRLFGAAGQLLALQMDFNRRMDIRQKRIEEAVSTITVRTDRSEEEVAELRRRLERLEAGGDST